MLCSRSRNDLAEALDLLKAQIDPKLIQTQGGSASGSPEREAKADTGRSMGGGGGREGGRDG